MDKFFNSNNFARILAVFLAVSLWLFVTGDEITNTTPIRKLFPDVPLVYENLPSGLVVTGIRPAVDVTLEGLPGSFGDLSASEVEAYVDLTDRREGIHQLQVRGKPPRGLQLVAFTPNQVEVIIDELVSMLVPVQVEMEGTPAAGWKINGSPLCHPEKIQVEAARSVVEKIDRVVVRADLTGAQGVYRAELAFEILDGDGEEIREVSINPEKVTVTVALLKE